ncbi:DNA lyase [Streptomyces avermitilis]|uniref:Formamidopyrimidine-DNA glycosylase n=2 Tax=Streptomyces avermitilis TaxID=33903 RepID=Q826A4_STRAW|nr:MULTISPECIES: DNA-formamidopyrimidine glycosylase family protein [Streptomyces]KUN53381.1 DNA lyase [Streptomyces avermitilis]MYT02828.1 Fpg/Nei family DNA glycosylase [Streptomyces sp. SID5469]OOV17952.1 endonuclease VIII [Streptomyces avermitilis]BAC75000.1 putative formamidopyrimidine-DNA glycosylase [Streptomyces avermitilis MA-4680 = NBRC 14893]BBJ55637.1 formamidopyrimidine-DNA glycosylase [Streptomyces avermitilis]
MPELPEVEALKDFLADHVVGHEVVRVLPVAISVLKTYDPPVTALEGREITAVRRHGKFLDLEADGLHFVTHLARGGWLHWRDKLPDAPPRPGKGPLALRVALETGEGFDLTEAGTQKRLAVHVVRDPGDVPGVARLGPDPLADDFDEARFARLLEGERRRIKGALRDQSLIAGVGNAYSDEILHAAKMSPFKLTSALTAEEIRQLYAALRTTLTEAVERSRGLAAGRLKAEKKTGLRVHGRTGEPCPVCGDTIREVSFSDSSLQYCPTCQTGGRPLADRRMSRLLK